MRLSPKLGLETMDLKSRIHPFLIALLLLQCTCRTAAVSCEPAPSNIFCSKRVFSMEEERKAIIMLKTSKEEEKKAVGMLNKLGGSSGARMRESNSANFANP